MQNKAFLFSVLIIGLAQGCYFSASYASSSGSSGNSSESSASHLSSPSSSEDDNKKYQLAILNYTSAYINSSKFNRFAYTRGISEIATANGITNWEENKATLTAIGHGLKNSSITNSSYEIYKSSIANANTNRMQIIQKGYDMQ